MIPNEEKDEFKNIEQLNKVITITTITLIITIGVVYWLTK